MKDQSASLMRFSTDAANPSRLTGARANLVVVLGVLPWLDPVTYGPTPAIVPWLVSMACQLVLWILSPSTGASLQWRTAAASVSLGLWAVVSHPAIHQEAVFLAGGLVLLTLATSSAVGGQVRRALQLGLLLAAGLSAAFGLCQYFGLSARFSPWMNYAPAGEAFGNLRQPNQYASLCWLGLAVLLWGRPGLPRAVAFGIAALLAVASAASVSRTGLLQGLLLTMLAAIWPGPQRRLRLQICAVAAGAYFLATLALPFALEATTGALPARTLWGRMGSGESCSSRLVLWSNVLHLIALKPWFGWGWGELDFAHFTTLYPGERFCDILDNAHNLPLHLAVELGVPAAVAVCGGFLWWVARQRPWAERDAQRQLAWGVLAVILVHSLLEYPLWYGPFQIAFGAALGWLLATPEAKPSGQARWASAAAAAVLLAATAYAGWDYARVSQVYLPPEERRAAWAGDPLGAASHSWLFANQARFAALTITPLTRANAEWMFQEAEHLLHYSPEPRVIERLVESATLTGHTDEAVLTLARYRAAFPREYAAWQARQGGRAARRLPQD